MSNNCRNDQGLTVHTAGQVLGGFIRQKKGQGIIQMLTHILPAYDVCRSYGDIVKKKLMELPPTYIATKVVNCL